MMTGTGGGCQFRNLFCRVGHRPESHATVETGRSMAFRNDPKPGPLKSGWSFENFRLPSTFRLFTLWC